MTEILPATSAQALKLARRLLRKGEVVAFPTDTVYGVGANAFNRLAVRKIFRVKARPTAKALPVFVTQFDDLHQVARHVPNNAWPFLQRFWPGALTVVLPKAAALPEDVTAGQDTVAVRWPNHPLCAQLVVQAGWPLAVTSANLSGQSSPTTAQEVGAQLGGRLPLILDGGQTATPHPSSIVDLSVSPPRLLREGDLKLATLREHLPGLQGMDDEGRMTHDRG